MFYGVQLYSNCALKPAVATSSLSITSKRKLLRYVYFICPNNKVSLALMLKFDLQVTLILLHSYGVSALPDKW